MDGRWNCAPGVCTPKKMVRVQKQHLIRRNSLQRREMVFQAEAARSDQVSVQSNVSSATLKPVPQFRTLQSTAYPEGLIAGATIDV